MRIVFLSQLGRISMAIKTIKIHPAIGIARVGDSPTEFFIGPGAPL
jgi:hypothetical protein